MTGLSCFLETVGSHEIESFQKTQNDEKTNKGPIMDMKDHWVSVDYTCLDITRYSIFIGAFELNLILGSLTYIPP